MTIPRDLFSISKNQTLIKLKSFSPLATGMTGRFHGWPQLPASCPLRATGWRSQRKPKSFDPSNGSSDSPSHPCKLETCESKTEYQKYVEETSTHQ